MVNFDIQDVILNYDAKLNKKAKHITCVMNNPLSVDTNVMPTFTADTTPTNLPFQNLELPLPPGSGGIQLQSGALQAIMNCKRLNGDDMTEMQEKIEDTPDQLINRMMTLLGFVIAILIAYSFMFETLLRYFVVDLMNQANGLRDNDGDSGKINIKPVGLYFAVLNVLLGLCFLVYSFVQPNAKRHLWIGIMFFVLVAMTNFLYSNLRKRAQGWLPGEMDLTISSIWQQRKIMVIMLGICLFALVGIFTSILVVVPKPESGDLGFIYGDSSAVLVYLVAIFVYCMDAQDKTPGNNHQGKPAYWIRFGITCALMCVLGSTLFTEHATSKGKA